ncbi:hypothetical protein HPC49_27260 [Pyxidicoccus fallax]|uniref:Uncharacterized protein n=1 Tax=Pyxidicoccus fallax TaxID=394095 RepID=A0A848LIJ2_9BACT|nr:AHH domain-containing protein [Pyxidicoccus fallax]NMO17516.1 hypothetical protein [Pyxidicoccus fallax]NPC81905.1 hypothetical protein [Pyxidicoccus fallax]
MATDVNAHLLKTHPIKAILERNSKYADNGRSEISGNGGKRSQVYDNDAKIAKSLNALGIRPQHGAGYTQGSTQHCAAYHFDKFVNALKPYYNVAHHILPCEVFKAREPGKKSRGAFTDEQLEILKRTTYDVNNGKNIIFLPGFSVGLIVQWGVKAQKEKDPGFNWDAVKETDARAGWVEKWSENARKKLERYGAVHQLPCHIDFHEDYILQVRGDMDAISKELKRQAESLCEDWKPPENIPPTLIGTQDEYWKYIVNWGEKNPLGNINAMEKLADAAMGKAPGKKKLSK